jgi:lambda repressor-like predicted transcriptional regulator
LTVTQRSEIVQRYEAGESAAALAREFGVDRQTLVNHLKRAGVEVRYRIVDQIDVAEAQELYASGLSLAGVGERFGVSARSVLNAFRTAGFVTRPVGTNQWRSVGHGR